MGRELKKRGRPVKKETARREHTIALRVSEAEYVQLERCAREAGAPLGTWGRIVLLERMKAAGYPVIVRDWARE